VPPSLPALAVIVLNRMGFGPRPGDIAAFDALGADDDARLAAYVAQQLNPDPVEANDPDYHERRRGLNGKPDPGFVTLDQTLTQLWTTYQINNVTPNRPVDETRLDTLCRMVYSKWQLREILADFWHNHFNVYGFENYTQETLVAYDRDVVRANLFGNFRTLLEAVGKSTTMLYFLDNYTNTRSGPNENYARELFELHTLGAENYFGVEPQANVPQEGVWPPGLPGEGLPRPAGYVDADVYEAARCFTGWGVDGTLGTFLYTDANHDRFQKSVLDKGVVNLPADQPTDKDGKDVYDLLASHPGTGRFLVRKLCRRLVADDPPQSLIDTVAPLFTSLWQAGDQLKQVYEAILLSSEFRNTWAEKVKRPVEVAVSALRAASPNWLFGYSSQVGPTIETDTSNFLSRLSKTGHTLFGRVPPDGFPDRREKWSSSNSRVQCWRLAGWLIDQDIDGDSATDDFRCDVVGTTLASSARSANQLADFWIDRVLGRPMADADRDEIVGFMAAGANPNLNLNLNDSLTKKRLRSMVALLMMSPDFFWK
jgi:uncharacterized protein (DUF1800 family)